MDGEPGVHLTGIGRTGFGPSLLGKKFVAETESDHQCAARFQKIATNHAAPPAITREARWMAFMILGYVPQRHKWPFIAVRICASVGLGVFERSSELLMIMPLKQ